MQNTRFQAGFSYIQHHLMPISEQHGALFAKLGIGTADIQFSNFGNDDYRETSFSAGYSLRILSNLALGANMHLLSSNTSDPHYNDLPPSLTFSVGILYHEKTKYSIGAKIFNPIFTKLGDEQGSRIPVVMNIGGGYHLNKSWLATAEIEKNIYLHHTARFGLEYCYNELLFARIGFSSNPSTWSFGLGYCGGHTTIDLAAQVHSILGITPQISASYRF